MYHKPNYVEDGIGLKIGRMYTSAKCYSIFKAMYDIGGKGDSKKIFNVISAEDKQKYNINTPQDVMWSVTRKRSYIKKLKEQGEKYQDIYGGKYRRVYELRSWVFENIQLHLEEQNATQ